MEADTDWDFVIVGAGSAGCVVANRLSEDSRRRVLLIEAGGSDSHPFSKIPAAIGLAVMSRALNWHFLSAADPSRAGRVDMWPAGRLLGGGSSINGMMYVRGNRWDYDQWETLGAAGWGYEGVLPYFKRLERNERGADAFRGSSGPQWVSEVRIDHPLTSAFVEGMVELGVPRNPDLNGATQEGVGLCQVTQRKGVRHSTSAAYLAPIRGRRNLTVVTHALVERVDFDGHRATGVSYRVGNTVLRARARCGVVLSAGALSTPKLLLLSGIGASAALRQRGIDVRVDAPAVGKNLQEHPGLIVSPHVTTATLTSDLGPTAMLRAGWSYLTQRRGPITTPVGFAHAFIRTRPQLPAPNIQIIFSPSAFDHHERGATPYRKPAITLAVGLCRVKSRGEVTLRSDRATDPPDIRYALLGNEDDLEQLVEGVAFARRLFTTREFGRYFVDERKPGVQFAGADELKEEIRRSSFLMYHPCGTCRMGEDAAAVVDSRLRVRGADALWIADASVMPTLPAGNINATCIMIGEKAADLILEQNPGVG